MNIILTTTLVIMAIGLLVGVGLVFTGKKFAVKVDKKEVAVREKLPGNTCGACGFGCAAQKRDDADAGREEGGAAQ